MPLMACDTRAALGENAKRCESRSLLMDRFAKPDVHKDDRKEWFERLIRCRPDAEQPQRWRRFLFQELRLPSGRCVAATLQARLIVNGGSGVMENAGLSLDRFSGVPFIPGSAVRGCARRAAIARLKEMVSAADKMPCLEQIARVFGWVSSDWAMTPVRPKREIPDFRWACGEVDWPEIAAAVQARLMPRFPGAKAFPAAYAGEAIFLPAYPDRMPANDLELDVVTCHYPAYYRGQGERQGENPNAEDTESPIPVVFPVAAPGLTFLFAIMSRGRLTDEVLITQARAWLLEGLTDYGLGAKTNAGYGWFADCTEKWFAALKQEEEKEQERQRQAAEQDARRLAEEQRRKRQKDLENLPADQRAEADVAGWTDDKLRSFLFGTPEGFDRLEAPLRNAIVRALAGSRAPLWDALKRRAAEGRKTDRDRARKMVEKINTLARNTTPRIQMP